MSFWCRKTQRTTVEENENPLESICNLHEIGIATILDAPRVIAVMGAKQEDRTLSAGGGGLVIIGDLISDNKIIPRTKSKDIFIKIRLLKTLFESGTAEVILGRENFRIGVVKFTLTKHTKLNQCFKCLGYNNVAKECEGPDRTKLCRKCGKEGHIAKNCTNAEHCPLCKNDDHQAGKSRCWLFKMTLAKERQGSPRGKRGSAYPDRNRKKVEIKIQTHDNDSS
ncbi:hypothetical protein HHI36_016917 [Cryptolaemus montrouzieri]|uniref:CCHC-type domain-containing protein n=1 Tax=Cryptolaemus montrouzieri TaxID=559131 RepID=A0ABD2NKY8_9CUCU